MRGTAIVWKKDIRVPEALLREVGGNRLLAEILCQRGLITAEEARVFLNPGHYKPSSPWDFPGMEQAVALILAALERRDYFCVYGDYDVDGITSTTLLVNLFRGLGAKVTFHVPDRFKEGYGMNEEVIRRLAQEGVKFLVTCDCGISNVREVALARELGMTVVVTDHHLLPPRLPEADAIINPQFLPEGHPAGHIPGVGVAYFLARAVLSWLGRAEEADDYLDLVALGVVGDVVPLRHENRYLLQKGLPRLIATTRPGLVALLEVSGVVRNLLTEEEIGFQLVPRLNASGRIASARLGVELLLVEDEGEAVRLAKAIDNLNKKRREIGEKMQGEALAMVGQMGTPRPLVLYQPHWHHGIIGIAAGRLCESYGVPAALMSLKDDGQTITGSARSIEGIHVFAALQKCSQFLNKFGGHAGAAGFSLHRDNLTAFTHSLEQVLAEELQKMGGAQTITADYCLPLNQVSLEVFHDLRKLAPFGEANPAPLLYCPGVRVLNKRTTSGEKHLQLVLGHGEASHRAVWWWGGGADVDEEVDLLYTMGLNRWKGRESLQLVVNHLQPVDGGLLEKVREVDRRELVLEDWRNWAQLGRRLPEFPEAVYFYEGLGQSPGMTGVDRNGVGAARVLVLLSFPADLRLFRELILLSGTRKVVLAFSQREIKSGEEFIRNLAGLVKYAVSQGGRVALSQLAALTNELEYTVVTGLLYLQKRGLIEIEHINPGEVLVEKGSGQTGADLKMAETKLKGLLAESRSFRKYLLETNLAVIEKYLNR
ncbi:MAG: single-stranded-DNA-specific exonuclease RecJ [Thermincolia bacterium]